MNQVFLRSWNKWSITCVLLFTCGMLSFGQDNGVLKVVNGKLLKNGKEYRGFGINASFLCDNIMKAGADAKESLAAIEYLGKKKIPFMRTWVGYLNNWKPYFNDEAKYWRNMDLLVDTCENANVALIPTLFWKPEYVPWEFNETNKDMMNSNSEGRKFMKEYIKKFVSRYKNRNIVWMWEWSNESNLVWDLPHERTLKNRDNVFTYQLGIAISKAFADEVRLHDSARRPLSTGNSCIRNDFYNRCTNNADAWKKDNAQESYIAASWCSPEPYDMFSMHHYAYLQNNKYELDSSREQIRSHMAWAAKLKQPFFLGEFGMLLKNASGSIDWSADPDIDMNAYKDGVRQLFQLVYEEKVPLAAWWVYTPRVESFHIGVINPKYGKFEWIVDIISEYNDKIEADLKKGETKP